jgi:hypothetical protein
MVQAARLTERLLRDPRVAAEYHEAFLLPGALAISQFNRPGLAGKVLSLAAEMAANSPGLLRRTIFGRAFKSGALLRTAVAGEPFPTRRSCRPSRPWATRSAPAPWARRATRSRWWTMPSASTAPATCSWPMPR